MVVREIKVFKDMCQKWELKRNEQIVYFSGIIQKYFTQEELKNRKFESAKLDSQYGTKGRLKKINKRTRKEIFKRREIESVPMEKQDAENPMKVEVLQQDEVPQQLEGTVQQPDVVCQVDEKDDAPINLDSSHDATSNCHDSEDQKDMDVNEDLEQIEDRESNEEEGEAEGQEYNEEDKSNTNHAHMWNK
eukprot:CAMPEP_0168319230 /NCGR_PEP_ID=MMETSP0213-20121227/931_1 /TAXON_ID=151035 /ORGANISM="Euplotes harpa, Strain FSP1.4" /LENGTH=189 /DNA_ID=CAMNT_0008320409 /DNA_START=146 /DNA_END=715 /DNA_ORIENTATION=+